MKAESEVNGANITLGNISDVSNPELAGLVLDIAPARGKTTTWSVNEVSRKLRAYQGVLKDIHFKIPKKLKITKTDFKISDAEIKNEITLMLKKLLPNQDWEVSLKSLQKIQWPELSGSAQVKIIPLNIRPRGAALFEVVIEDEGKTLNHIWLNGEAEYFAKVAVVQKPVLARSYINSDYISWERRNVTYMTEIPASEIDFVASVAKSNLPSGLVITKNNLDRELAVKFGEEVEITIGDDSISVSTKAISQQNAYVGDLIKLRTVNGNKFLTGTVVAKKQVQVSF